MALIAAVILAACQGTPTPAPEQTPAATQAPTRTPSPSPTTPPSPSPTATAVTQTSTPTPTPTSTATPARTPAPSPTASAAPIATPTPRNVAGQRIAGVPRGEALALAEGEPRTLDPVMSQDTLSHMYVGHIFNGLVRFDAGLQLQPDLAESWQVLDGGTRYVFRLRETARFHDGRPLTAHDVAYSLERATDPALDSPTAATYLGDIAGVRERLAGEAESIAGVHVLNDRSIEIVIDGPKPYFLAKLTYPVAFVVDRSQVQQDQDWRLRPNGSGPFRLKEWQAGEHIVLERATGFYRPGSGVRYLVFRLLAGVPLSLYERGQVDVAWIGAGGLLRALDPASGLYPELRAYGRLSVTFVGFNAGEPPFDDPQVRRAFAMSVDVDRMVDELLLGYAQRARGLLPPGLPGYDPDQQGIHYDPAEARRLLEESSYGGPDGLPPLVYTSSGLDFVDATVSAAVAMWRENLGVEVRVRLLDPQEYYSRLDEEVDNLFDYGWVADYPDPENFLDVLFHSGQANNAGGYASAEVDALLEAARTAADAKERMALYRQAQDLLLQDAAAIPLWHGASYLLVKPYVQGYAVTPQGMPTFEHVSLTG